MAACEVCGNDYCAGREGYDRLSDRADAPVRTRRAPAHR